MGLIRSFLRLFEPRAAESQEPSDVVRAAGVAPDASEACTAVALAPQAERAGERRSGGKRGSGGPDQAATRSGSALRDGDEESQAAPRPWWLPRDDAPVAPHGPQTVDKRLYDRIVASLDDQHLELPKLPEIAKKVLNCLRDDGGDMRRAAEFAGHDPALAAEILRIANSVAYRGVREITRLEQAFVRLGQKTLRGILLASTMKQLAIRVGGAHKSVGEQLWRGAWASGIIVGHFSKRYAIAEDEAFLIGLLHDIGQLGILKVTCEFQQTHNVTIARPVFDALCRRWHEHLGARIASAWNLPEPLPQLIGAHHRAPDADDSLRTQRWLIQLADVICAQLDYAPYEPVDFFALPCVSGLGLTDAPETHRLLAPLRDILRDQMHM